MPELPVLSEKELIKFHQKQGFAVVRQKGSHVSLQKEELKTIVPLHEELAKGTLLGILRQCGITRKTFLEIYSGDS